MNWMTNMKSFSDEYIEMFSHATYTDETRISEELGFMTKRLGIMYKVKNTDQLPWNQFDIDDDFKSIIITAGYACQSDGALNVLAIFCLDNGLFNCQMESCIFDLAYDDYLMAEALTARRLKE